jgi:hypothetical protein
MPKNEKKSSTLTVTDQPGKPPPIRSKWSSTLRLAVPGLTANDADGATPKSRARAKAASQDAANTPQPKRNVKPRGWKKKKKSMNPPIAKAKKKPEQKTMFTRMRDASIKYGRLRKVPGGAAGSQKR